jgi:hypothetical protein
LRIDDANEGELYDGYDKRIGSNNLDEEGSNNLGLKINKLKTNLKTSDTKSSTKPSTSSLSSSNSFKNLQQADNSSDYKLDKISEGMKKASLMANNESDEDAKFKEALERKKQERKLKDLIDIDETDRRKARDEELSSQKAQKSSNIIATQAQTKLPTNSLNNVNKIAASTSSSTPETNQDYTSRPIDLETARELRILLFGSTMQSFNDEWKIQSFTFCDYAKIKFGIVQKKGGSCGVLACVQAYVLLELIYANDEPPKDLNAMYELIIKFTLFVM